MAKEKEHWIVEYEQDQNCKGCKWYKVRHQKCTCCARNVSLKDNYETEKESKVPKRSNHVK